ncbi:MAG: hypothetical protein WD648_05095 [Planctomycetaceae bacterium]
MSELFDLILRCIEFVREQKALMWWLVALSILTFVGTLVVVPILIVRIPEDYFTRASRHADGWEMRHPAVRLAIIVLKNVAGIVFILVGIPMLPGPGQGVLTVLIGVMLLDFPGKYRLERSIIRRRPVHRGINWIRAKAHRPPLKIPM